MLASIHVLHMCNSITMNTELSIIITAILDLPVWFPIGKGPKLQTAALKLMMTAT